MLALGNEWACHLRPRWRKTTTVGFIYLTLTLTLTNCWLFIKAVYIRPSKTMVPRNRRPHRTHVGPGPPGPAHYARGGRCTQRHGSSIRWTDTLNHSTSAFAIFFYSFIWLNITAWFYNPILDQKIFFCVGVAFSFSLHVLFATSSGAVLFIYSITQCDIYPSMYPSRINITHCNCISGRACQSTAVFISSQWFIDSIIIQICSYQLWDFESFV